MADDMHSPTAAGPTPGATGELPSAPPPPGSSPAEHPEVQVGAAFAGGLIAALILKRLVS